MRTTVHYQEQLPLTSNANALKWEVRERKPAMDLFCVSHIPGKHSGYGYIKGMPIELGNLKTGYT